MGHAHTLTFQLQSLEELKRMSLSRRPPSQFR